MYGTNIQSPADALKKVEDSYLYSSLKNPKPAIRSNIEQLRTVYDIDVKRYAELKKKLPYVVCAAFNPCFRRKENFTYTESFILDFDHLAAQNIDMEELRKKICADTRVVMCFASPSRDGLKVMFHLEDRCTDSGLYSIFYKAFAKAFAQQMNIEQALDARTSDVSRACFVSVDENAYFNSFAAEVDMSAFVSPDNTLAAFDLMNEQRREEKEAKRTQEPAPHTEPTSDVMARIRQQLKHAAPVEEKAAFVPEQLNDIIGPLCDYIKQTGIEVVEVKNIQYAKKIRTRLGTKNGETNLFYGKRGYSVVESPRRGTDDELNKLVADIVKAFLAEPQHIAY